jgi:hypothetical protein
MDNRREGLHGEQEFDLEPRQLPASQGTNRGLLEKRRAWSNASTFEEAFSRGLEERGQQTVEPSPSSNSGLRALVSPADSSNTDEAWVPWIRREKLQPSALSASALAASSYRLHPLHVGRSCLSARSLDCAGFVQLPTQATYLFFVYTGWPVCIWLGSNRGLHTSARSRSRSLAP